MSIMEDNGLVRQWSGALEHCLHSCLIDGRTMILCTLHSCLQLHKYRPCSCAYSLEYCLHSCLKDGRTMILCTLHSCLQTHKYRPCSCAYSLLWVTVGLQLRCFIAIILPWHYPTRPSLGEQHSIATYT